MFWSLDIPSSKQSVLRCESKALAKTGSAILILAAILLGITGCADIRFYQQSIAGHLDVIGKAHPIDEILAREELPDETRQKLLLVGKARLFAKETLELSINESYEEYVDLERDQVLHNVVAAPEFSTRLHNWCYLVIGCANYRGYFDKQQLAAEKRRLEAEGLDVYSYPVIAYSTLGWFADPVLNTFLTLPEPRMVGLIFHELAHQHVYINGDSAFNESFATAVERAALERFYSSKEVQLQLQNAWAVSEGIHALAQETREVLDALYQQDIAPETMRLNKQAILTNFSRSYVELIGNGESTNPDATSAMPSFNNARLGIMATYENFVPAFLNLLDHYHGAFEPFLREVERIGALPMTQREACLQYWAPELSEDHHIESSSVILC